MSEELVDTITEILASCLSDNDVRPRVGEIFDAFKEAGFIQVEEVELPESPYRYYSKAKRTPAEQEESFCDIGFHRAIGDILKAVGGKLIRPVKEE